MPKARSNGTPSAPPPLTLLDFDYFTVGERLRLLGVETRLKILAHLEPGEKSLSQIWPSVGVSQPICSSHLQAMSFHGLVEKRREGKLVYYRIADDWRPALVLIKLLATLPRR